MASFGEQTIGSPYKFIEVLGIAVVHSLLIGTDSSKLGNNQTT